MSSTDVTQIWNQHLRRVLCVEPANRGTAERAVERLYAAIGRGQPQIVWHEGERTLPIDQMSSPIHHITNSLLYGVWYKVPDIEHARIVMGYDPRIDAFRLTTNKALAFSYVRLKRDLGGYQRPHWARDHGNMICQFDAPFMAILDYAAKLSVRMDKSLRSVSQAVQLLLESAFGAILFGHVCVLLERPSRVVLDGLGLLSSTDGPAFEWRGGRELYAVNGIALPNNYDLKEKNIPIQEVISAGTPQRRVALIEYIGWDKFLRLMISHGKRTRVDNTQVNELNQSKWGTLYRIICGNQEIMVVEVRNATKEKDGTYQRYVIPVDRLLRPLPNPRDPHGVLGEPQDLTSLNAVASTFGMTGHEYRSMLGAES